MISRLWAVAKNTFISAMRMKTAIVFMLLLIVLLPVLSITSTGDGTAVGKAQSFISYGLGLVSLLLSLLTIIVSCHTLSSDIKNRRIYTVITKPLRRFELVAGKMLGVVMLDLLLLFVSGSIIYALAIQMPKLSKASADEIKRLDDEFYTARASLTMQIDEQAITARVNEAYEYMKKNDQLDSSHSKQFVIEELTKAARLEMRSAAPGGMVMWEFEKVKPFDPNDKLYLRFKFNAAQTPTNSTIYGTWYIGDYRQIEQGGGAMKTPIYTVPRKDIVKMVREFEVPADAVADDGYLAVAFYNEPANQTAVIFSEQDGFEVLYKAGNFTHNYLSAMLIMFVRLIFLAALGVSVTTWLGFPVAILLSLSIFFTGIINGFIVGSFDYLGKNITFIYDYTIKPLIWLLPKFDEKYNINRLIIDARLIDMMFMAKAAGLLLLKSVIILLLGFLIFAKREIAKVII